MSEKVIMAHCSNCPKLLDKLKHEKYVSDVTFDALSHTRDVLKDALDLIVERCSEHEDIKTFIKTSKLWIDRYNEENELNERGNDTSGQV